MLNSFPLLRQRPNYLPSAGGCCYFPTLKLKEHFNTLHINTNKQPTTIVIVIRPDYNSQNMYFLHQSWSNYNYPSSTTNISQFFCVQIVTLEK